MNQMNSRIVRIHTGIFIQIPYMSYTALKLNTLLHKIVLSVCLTFIFKRKRIFIPTYMLHNSHHTARMQKLTLESIITNAYRHKRV